MRPRLTTSCFVRDCANTFEMLRSSRERSVLHSTASLSVSSRLLLCLESSVSLLHDSGTWKLRDPACAAEFEAKFEEKCSSGLIADSAMQSTEEIWDHLKSTLNSAAEEVCGYTKTTSGRGRPGGGIWRSTRPWRRSVGVSKSGAASRSRKCMAMPA